MRRFVKGFAGVALAASALGAGFRDGLAAQDSRAGLAVIPFENGGSYGKDREEFDALRKGLAATLASELALNPSVRLVDREQTQRFLDQQGLGVAERVDAATAAKVGKLAGVHYIITGSFIDLYGDFRIDARLVNAETGEILKVVRSDPRLHDRRDMFRMVQSVAERLMTGAPLPPLPAALAQRAGAKTPVPTEALTFYSRALLYQDRSDKAKAIEYYQKALAVFPTYTDASDGLRKVRGNE